MEDSDAAIVTIDNNVTSVHFSITGRSWAMLRKYFPELVPKVSPAQYVCDVTDDVCLWELSPSHPILL